nr:MAG TPA: hypothetical protein [Caudoviricetes sp.]
MSCCSWHYFFLFLEQFFLLYLRKSVCLIELQFF